MDTGTVLSYSGKTGYGWIEPDAGGPNLWVHANDLQHGQEPDILKTGTRVGWTEVRDGAKGPRAMRVRAVQSHTHPLIVLLRTAQDCIEDAFEMLKAAGWDV